MREGPRLLGSVRRKVGESVGKPPFYRWLVIRAEAYVAAHPGRQQADQSAAAVDAYLAALGRKPEVTGWQVRQAADAIRIRLALAGVAWVREVDGGIGRRRRGTWARRTRRWRGIMRQSARLGRRRSGLWRPSSGLGKQGQTLGSGRSG